MRYTIIILLNFEFLFSFAQPALNKVYGEETGNAGYTIIPEQNGYFIAGDGYSAQFASGIDWWSAIKLYRVDSLGSVLWEKEYGKVSQGWETGEGGCTKKTEDGGYIIPGNYRDSATGIYSGIVLRVDSTGDTEWLRTFTLGDVTGFNDCVETSDKGFAVIGVTTGFGDPYDALYLIKLDSAGTLLWQRTYNSDSEGIGIGIHLLDDGGFLLGGLIDSAGPGIVNNYLIRTDSLGNIKWAKTYGSSGSNEACVAFPSKNGDYIMTGLWDTLVDNYSGGGCYIARLDTLGNIKWLKFCSDSVYLWQVRELENGDIIGVGEKDKPPAIGYLYDGYIAKMDSNGNNLWNKILQYTGPGPYPGDIPYMGGNFYDFQSINDSGFVLTGTYIFNTDSITQIQEIWLVKTDSNGCIDSYCGIEGLEEINLPILKNSLAIFPNPAQNIATVEWQPVIDGQNQVVIYDMLGREVKKASFSGAFGKWQIDVSDLENGLYVVKLMSPTGARMGSGKLTILK